MDTCALAAARDSGLIRAGAPLLVLISGGADSTCLLDVGSRLGARVAALHVNYGLRRDSDADEAHCRALCERAGVELTVERVRLPGRGNLQAAAREARYSLAERLAADDYATGHTLDDQAETVLYRLATSPGRRALIGMRPRNGRLVRPLIAARRADTREHCRAAGLDWREDASNADPRFARARLRAEVMPVLEQLGPAARNMARTSRLLADEAEVLDALVADTLERLGDEPHVDALASLAPALRHLTLRELAERAGAAALPRDAVERIAALDARGSHAVDVGGGVQATVEYGRLRFARAHTREAPPPARLPVPGSVTFGAYRLEAGGRDGVELDAAAVGSEVLVRPWADGDRMRPAGLGGTKKLQDLFTDRKVPRAARHELPVVVAGDEIAWVPGVAVAERFRPRPSHPVVAFSATRTRA